MDQSEQPAEVDVALWKAAIAGDVEELERLLQQGANADSQHEQGTIPGWQSGNAALHFAAASNQPDIIRALIEAGANVDIQNKNGRTPVAIQTQNLPNSAVDFC